MEIQLFHIYRVGQKNIAQSLVHRYFATVSSIITRFSSKWLEINW